MGLCAMQYTVCWWVCVKTRLVGAWTRTQRFSAISTAGLLHVLWRRPPDQTRPWNINRTFNNKNAKSVWRFGGPGRVMDVTRDWPDRPPLPSQAERASPDPKQPVCRGGCKMFDEHWTVSYCWCTNHVGLTVSKLGFWRRFCASFVRLSSMSRSMFRLQVVKTGSLW